jgi:hypothetical protein
MTVLERSPARTVVAIENLSRSDSCFSLFAPGAIQSVTCVEQLAGRMGAYIPFARGQGSAPGKRPRRVLR